MAMITHIKLTSAELGNIWTTYMSESMSICFLKYFKQKVTDPEISPVLDYACELSAKHLTRLTDIMNDENIPIPHGFSDDDVNLEAPALYSDNFYLVYLENMGRVGMNAYSIALPLSAREDIRQFFSECLQSAIELTNKAKTVLLSKGLLIRPPMIPYPEKVDFVKKQNFLTGWFGERKSLLSMEIAHLYANMHTNELGKSLLMGFGQVAKSKDVTEFMLRGKNIALKHIEVLGSLLREDDLPSSITWDTAVTRSTVSPFSDKLMMFHTTSLTSVGIADYGASVSTSSRRDLVTQYMRLMGEVGKYAEDAMNIMIDNGWMEEPPQSADRDALAQT